MQRMTRKSPMGIQLLFLIIRRATRNISALSLCVVALAFALTASTTGCGGVAPSDDDDSLSDDDDSVPPPFPPDLVCNGDAALCWLPFDELVLPGTHNSMSNAADGWIAPNQQFGLARQLDDGIRGMLLDSKEFEGDLYLCHGDCYRGSILLSEALTIITDFLVQHPGEVLAIIFQDSISPEQTEQAFAEAGLDALVYTHEEGAAWPLVGELVAADTRLLVSAEFTGPPPAWYHHAWDLFQDTHYAFTGVDVIHCDPNRGNPDNPLFLMNHWVDGFLGLPLEMDAEVANQSEVLLEQVDRCFEERGVMPNLVAVDFYAVGDLFEVVDQLNGLSR